jgi:hypothetical protein
VGGRGPPPAPPFTPREGGYTRPYQPGRPEYRARGLPTDEMKRRAANGKSQENEELSRGLVRLYNRMELNAPKASVSIGGLTIRQRGGRAHGRSGAGDVSGVQEYPPHPRGVGSPGHPLQDLWPDHAGASACRRQEPGSDPGAFPAQRQGAPCSLGCATPGSSNPAAADAAHTRCARSGASDPRSCSSSGTPASSTPGSPDHSEPEPGSRSCTPAGSSGGTDCSEPCLFSQAHPCNASSGPRCWSTGSCHGSCGSAGPCASPTRSLDNALEIRWPDR